MISNSKFIKQAHLISSITLIIVSQLILLTIDKNCSGHRIVASTGGKPKPKVNLLIRDQRGRNIKAAKFGDPLEFLLRLSPDSKNMLMPNTTSLLGYMKEEEFQINLFHPFSFTLAGTWLNVYCKIITIPVCHDCETNIPLSGTVVLSIIHNKLIRTFCLDAYKAIAPTHCMFSDKEKMVETGAKTLTFVQGRSKFKQYNYV